jgi:hypothetical protein
MSKKMEKFNTGAKRSERKPRYDLIPTDALIRLAERFTGDIVDGKPTGGALKYGETNWVNGLPTSDVYNHIIGHLTTWAKSFQTALHLYKNDMESIRAYMVKHSSMDDDLAGAMWGICVLMYQESNGMFHDTKYPTRD